MARQSRVMAANLRVGDVLEGKRISHVIHYTRRCRANDPSKAAFIGVLVIMPASKGYDLDVQKFAGHEYVFVRRPAKNRTRLNTR